MALAVTAYRFGVNLGAQSTHPWYAAANTAVNFGADKTGTFLLRTLVQATGAGQNNVDFQLRYKLNAGAFTDVTTSSSVIRAVTTTVFADAANTTARLGGTGTFESSSAGCSHDGLCGGANFDIVTDGNGECLFSLQMQTADTAPGDVITFDMLVDGATFTQSVTPTINVVAGPVEVVRTLDTAGGFDYTTMALWESTEQQDFVAQNEVSVLECHEGTTSESFFVGGSTTDATHYREIRAATGHEHNGDFSAGFIAASNSATACSIKPFDDDLRINGIVIRAGSQTSNSMISCGGGTSVGTLRVGNCLIDGEGAGPTQGIDRTTGVGADRYWNNVIRGMAGACIRCNQAGSTFVVSNNTLVGGTHGVQQISGTVHLKNNIAQSNSTACYSGTFSSSATNISSDATGSIQSTLTFVDAANKDYHLDATDTDAIGAGTDLTADANHAFSTDFEGDTRPAGVWDIGADELVAAAGGGLRSPLLLLGVGF